METSIRRLLIAGLALVPCTVSCLAQDSWAAYLQEWSKAPPERKQWTLLVRPGDQKATWWRRDDDLARLSAEQELDIQGVDPATATRIWTLREWGTVPHWLLLGRTGENVFDGEGTPKGEHILAAIHTVEEKTSWERREAFLRENPDNGEALEARLVSSLFLAAYRYKTLVEDGKALPSRPERPGRFTLSQEEAGPAADQVFAEVAGSLESLLSLPDGWRLGPATVSHLGIFLRAFDAGSSPRMVAALLRVREAALQEWARSPNTEAGSDVQSLFGLSALWAACDWTLEDGTLGSLPRLTPAPGRIFPSYDLLLFAANQLRDPEKLLTFLAKVPMEPPEGPVDPAQWKTYLHRQADLAALVARANAHLGRWEPALAALEEGRRWSGSGWKGMGILAEFRKAQPPSAAADNPTKPQMGRKEPPAKETHSTGKPKAAHPVKPEPAKTSKPSAPPSPATTSPIPDSRPGDPPKEFLDVLASDPLPDLPPPPGPSPIRMVLWGSPAWSKDWMSLARTPALAPWGPDELRWTPSTREDETALAALGWEAPRWAIFQGPSTLLASGDTLPVPALMALGLSASGPTRLQRLSTFIRQNPDHLDARRERFALLRPRMPNSALEGTLAEDAARAGIPLEVDPRGPWSPALGVWGREASRLMPELEAALRRWPSSRTLWRLWVAWLPYREKPLSPFTFALGLRVPRDQGEWLADLPKEVHQAVAAELRGNGLFGPMRDWFQAAWDVASQRKDDPAGNRETLRFCLAEALAGIQGTRPHVRSSLTGG